MAKFTIRISQRVYYDVEVEALTPSEALTTVANAIHSPDVDAPGLDEMTMIEADTDEFEIEPTQTDAEGDDYCDEDPNFACNLATVAKGRK